MEEQPKKQGSNRRLPPVETRFKKGQSGNPKGRPPKELCLTSLVKEELEQQAKTKEGKLLFNKDGTPKTYAQLLAGAIVSQAAKGNRTALQQLWERVDGKVPIKLEHAGANGNPEININLKDKRKKLVELFQDENISDAAEKIVTVMHGQDDAD